MLAAIIPPVTIETYVSKNVNPSLGPAKGANINLMNDSKNRVIIDPQDIPYTFSPNAKSPASPNPGTIYD